MIVKIRETVTTGDTGHLIMASASNSILFTVQNTLTFIGVYSLLDGINSRFKAFDQYFTGLLILIFFLVNYSISVVFIFPWESVTNLIACSMTVLLLSKPDGSHNSVFRAAIVSLQIFFAFQWLNIMPSLSNYLFGLTDIPTSIKLTSTYLESTNVMNFVGMAFFSPLLISAVITSILFVSFDRNIRFANENHQKEKDLNDIRTKALENRIYEEIHTLTHDLKTPLVTIRGLSSLLAISHDISLIDEYTDRIDGAVEKMSEMITSFLYDTSRQMLTVEQLVNYVRAQIPIENEQLTLEFKVAEGLSKIYANKVRMVRALINILENAMVVPTHAEGKIIRLEITGDESGVIFCIEDNGVGISADLLDKIWDVGFSTLNTSGLGLSFAKKVIEDNNGRIEIETTVNIGTKVRVFLPDGEALWEARHD